MRPLTDTVPKPLLKPVADRRLLDWNVDALAKVGVTEIVINCAHLSRVFLETIPEYYRGAHIAFSVEGETYGESLETKGGIVYALSKLSPSGEPFIVCAGDVVSGFDFKTLAAREKQFSQDKTAAHLVLVPNPEFNLAGDMGLRDGRVVPNEKTYTYGGIGLFAREIFDNEPAVFSKLFPWLLTFAKDGRVSGELFDGPWHNVGTPDVLQNLAAELALEGLYP